MTNPRTCPTCGAQVADKERFCANCGSRLPEEPAEAPAATPTIVLGPQPGAEPTQALPAIPPAQSAPPPTAEPAFSVPPSAGAAPPARRGMPVWAIVLLAVTGLCAVGCIAVFVGLNLLGQQVGETFEEVGTTIALTAEAGGFDITPESGGVGGLIATSAPEEEPTAEPAPTVPTLGDTPEAAAPTAGAGGIVGGVGGVGGSAASQAQTAEAQTAEAAAVEQAAAATAEIEQIYAGASVIFQDEFVDNRNNWFTGVFQEIEEDRIEDGVFKVIWSADGSSYELYEVRELTNFITEVDCLIYVGGVDASCGLVFGQRDDVGFYKYEVFEDYYRLFIVTTGEPVLLVEGDPAGIVRPGEPNRLRVIKRGDEIRIYLNDVQLDAVTDATYPTGKVGVSTNSYIEDGPAEVWFDNFVVYQLP